MEDRAALASGVRVSFAVKIPLRDGIRLSATLYRPGDEAKRTPSLIAFTPYVADRNHGRAKYFAEHGFNFLSVDVRGRGNSEGEFRPYVNQAEDAYDVIEWAARQSFCNGKVGLFSGSYEGYAQWAAVKAFPPHLAVLAPAVAAAPGIDLPMRNNIWYPYNMRWLTLTSGRAAQMALFEDQEHWRKQFRNWYVSGRPFRELDAFVGNPSATFQEWLSHPALDAYWDGFRPTPAEYREIDVPILTVTGSYDADQPGAVHYYREHMRWGSASATARHYLVIGPWDHSALQPKQQFGGLRFGPAAMLDVLKLHLEWYRWCLEEGPRPAFLRKRVAYYVMGAERWRYTDTLEGITAETKPLYLDSPGYAAEAPARGFLAATPGRGPPDTYVYDPRDLSIAAAESKLALPSPPTLLRPTFPTDELCSQSQASIHDGKCLVYESQPFAAPTEVCGFFKLTVWLSIDQPDTDFLVTIHELLPDGGCVLLSCDLMRARYRESLRLERLIETADPLCYEFDRFTFIARQMLQGSRLRLTIGPANSIYLQKNYNSGGSVADESMGDARVVTVRVFHDERHPSALYLPLGETVT